MKIGDILLGRINKRYAHDMGATNSTSMDFGTVQPLYCTYLMKDSDVTINMRQLLRPAPMVSPTFGRVTEHTVTRFVPMSEIFPAFDALLSHRSIQGDVTYIPTSVPLITSSELCTLLCLEYCSMDVMIENSNGVWSYVTDWSSVTDQLKNNLWSLFNSRFTYAATGISQSSFIATVSQNIFSVNDNRVSVDSADFLINGYGVLLMFRLDSIGKRLYKILRGLGYGLDFTNNNNVSALPIFAFYKAYFDTYYNTRFLNWHNTKVYRYIQEIYNSGNHSNLLAYINLKDFITEFESCLYSSPADYVSVHTKDVLNSPVPDSGAPFGFQQYNIDSVNYTGDSYPTLTGDGKVPNLDTSDKTTWYQLQALKKLTQYISKDSVIGGRVVDWFKVHFGVTPSDDMFMPSQFIDEHIVNLDIDDIFATADTYNPETNTGSPTGSYNGKGLGFNKTEHGIKFTSKDFGYLIILGSVAPEQIYSCGDSPQLYGISRYTLPNTDFDAMGYELTPQAVIEDHSSAPSSTWLPIHNLTGKSFGFIPRYSGWKVQKSVLNGDLYLRSTRDGLSSYYLDKLMDTREATMDSDNYLGTTQNLLAPSASVLWSYPTGIDGIGDWNRIFYNRGFPSWYATRHGSRPPRTDDNFIFQSVFDVTVVNGLKPIRDSYDIDDPEENSKSAVQAQ